VVLAEPPPAALDAASGAGKLDAALPQPELPGGSSPTGDGDWLCDATGRRCRSTEHTWRTLPDGGERWECHRRERFPDGGEWDCGGDVEWVCYGDVARGAAAPGGGDWRCARFDFARSGRDVYRCVKPNDEHDQPPAAYPPSMCKCIQGALCAYCDKSSAGGGTACWMGTPAPHAGPPRAGEPCEPGARYWCEPWGLDGYGTVTCLPDGTLPTRSCGASVCVDCRERSDGRRPDTICACYHAWGGAACCERSDCRIPDHTDGQLCPPSSGAPCAHCDPLHDECAVGRCISSNASETFCSQACDATGACPAGTTCMQVKDSTAPPWSTDECIPKELACYW
jgi:hypothetical protein